MRGEIWSVSELLGEAWSARERAVALYSQFKVGAAILTSSGDIFRGCNIEIAAFGLTMCAERSAAISACCAGQCSFIALAIVADIKPAISPCGACLQFLAEFSPDLEIVSEGIDRVTTKWTLSKLLPVPFTKISIP
jgi:cytidine deaminase